MESRGQVVRRRGCNAKYIKSSIHLLCEIKTHCFRYPYGYRHLLLINFHTRRKNIFMDCISSKN